MEFKTSKGINHTGYGTISPTFRPLIKRLLLQHVSIFLIKELKIIFKAGNEIFQTGNGFFKQEMELCNPLPGL